MMYTKILCPTFGDTSRSNARVEMDIYSLLFLFFKNSIFA